MDACVAYLHFRDDDASGDAPQLRLEITADSRLSLTLPYDVEFTIRRRQDDRTREPILIRWTPVIDAFLASGLVLLEHGDQGSLTKVEIDYTRHAKLAEEDRILVNSYTADIGELLPGDSMSFHGTLPERYQRLLQDGRQYSLLWPGQVMAMWDWGTLQDHLGGEMRADPQKTPRLILPGGPRVTFTAQSEAEPWPGREAREAQVGFARANLDERDWRRTRHRTSPPPMQASERDEGAPRLTMTLTCAPTVPLGTEVVEVGVRVAYEGDATAPPVTFHTYALVLMHYTAREGFRFYRRRGDDGPWEECDEDDGDQGFLLVGDEDVTVAVGGHEHFRSLSPGQSFEDTRLVSLPDDAQADDRFRYVFKGATVDWWAWGDVEQHAATEVKLPSWEAGPVCEPADNGGRPRLVVPASNEVSFAIVAGSAH